MKDMREVSFMSKQVPFVVHIRVVPHRGNGKRFEYYRDLQKLSALVYDALINVSGIKVAVPGGGQNVSMGDVSRRGALGSFARGTAVKPQMGEVPAQLMIAGFYTSSGANAQPWANKQLISGGTVYTGPGAHAQNATPTTTIDTEVKAVKTAIKNAVQSAVPSGTVFSIFRIDYAGIVYGDKGFHFPR
jgi:hypothetical protein